jgi:hypothetical protein
LTNTVFKYSKIILGRWIVTEVENFEQRKTIGYEVEVSVMDKDNVRTSERGQSCNILGEGSQPTSGKKNVSQRY